LETFDIRPPEERDLAALDIALSALSRDLGDTHRSGTRELGRALFGTPPSTWALVADGSDGLAGVVLYAPVFSTVRGGAGLYVSDIWIDPGARGQRLGPSLLRRAAADAEALWDAQFMRLSVHDHNTAAADFYDRLGFRRGQGETVMMLTGQEFQRLRRMT
jgi:ribosomal protein S18 acetylase RimI-like enzyme